MSPMVLTHRNLNDLVRMFHSVQIETASLLMGLVETTQYICLLMFLLGASEYIHILLLALLGTAQYNHSLYIGSTKSRP